MSNPSPCPNCDDVKCMGCVFRDPDHSCVNDCPDCVVAAGQAAIRGAINTLGATLVGDGFKPLDSSPLSDKEVAHIIFSVCPLDEYRGQ